MPRLPEAVLRRPAQARAVRHGAAAAGQDAAERREAELQAAQWALAQWHAEEDDWVRDRATLESELAALNDDLNVSKRLNAKWMDERTEAIMRAEGAEEALAVQRLPHSPARMPRRGQVGQ